jgi:hypothetical protein
MLQGWLTKLVHTGITKITGKPGFIGGIVVALISSVIVDILVNQQPKEPNFNGAAVR